MDLCLLRHGKAEKSSVLYPDDFHRPLSPEGIEAMMHAARGIARLFGSFDLILTSPLVRARQTAEIVARACEYPHEVRLEDVLSGASDAVLMSKLLQKFPPDSTVLIVGHCPSLDHFLAHLVAFDAQVSVKLHPGSLAWIEIPDTRSATGILHALIPPEAW